MLKISSQQKKNLRPLNKVNILFAILLCLFPGSAFSQEQEQQEKPTAQQNVTERIRNTDDHNFLSFSYENDFIGNGQDQAYTSGLRITFFDVNTPIPPGIDKLADAYPNFDINETTSTFFTIGQNIFTPSNITVRSNQDNDRPWAAWLYGSVGLATVTKNHLDELEFTLGIVGPEALGEQGQKFVHDNITDSPIPQGWDNQLGFEPGIIMSWRRRWPVWHAKNIGDFRFRLEPDINASIGNIYTYAGAGISAQFGPGNDRIQDRPPRVRPAMAGTGFFDTPDDKFSWYLFGGIDTRLMGRNIFLDGNTFKDSHSVNKLPFVADGNAGLALTYDDYRLSYTINYRTKEFHGQDDESVFGSVTLTTRF